MKKLIIGKSIAYIVLAILIFVLSSCKKEELCRNAQGYMVPCHTINQNPINGGGGNNGGGSTETVCQDHLGNTIPCFEINGVYYTPIGEHVYAGAYTRSSAVSIGTNLWKISVCEVGRQTHQTNTGYMADLVISKGTSEYYTDDSTIAALFTGQLRYVNAVKKPSGEVFITYTDPFQGPTGTPCTNPNQWVII
ncbi:MAG: hypothetical protein LRY41_03240 [Candidatus Pacebacteria bacterium]|nr:hypothetical protein [Candidatus Paceibacterota bacterium]MCD8508043.1 hypothetical protein [Candidatus Paceibacterota bacterium]MCD8528309.1 hypothetical protein [Candidatus Paceibacterota bacterium]MCD8563824.1 hypothetical protein [Candidatus Paceibacterota bacterium]